MSTSYNAQIDNKNGKYTINFETGVYEYFKLVEKACQKAIDKKDRMTDSEIIKALECCEAMQNDCVGCPLLNYSQNSEECMTELINYAIDLIKRQQSEIEALKKVVLDDYATEYDNKIRLEAVKEFAERLKPMYKMLCVDKGDWFNEIDNLVKEMVDEDLDG